MSLKLYYRYGNYFFIKYKYRELNVNNFIAR